jgi:hypothetical protein
MKSMKQKRAAQCNGMNEWVGSAPKRQQIKSIFSWLCVESQRKELILLCVVPFHLFFNCFPFPFQTNKKEIPFQDYLNYY